jgi:catechol 2,3-dioxygenase
MASDPLDLEELLNEKGDWPWGGYPEGGIIGHVHLRVGEIEPSDRFYRDVLGFELTTRYPGASFYGSGGYHHQLAGNVWKSRHAGMRPQNMAGLGTVRIEVHHTETIVAVALRAERSGTPVEQTNDGIVLHDPWGTRFVLT